MEPQDHNPFDQAIADRLRRLSTMPVDLTALERRLRLATRPPKPTFVLRLLRPASGLAASVMVLVLIAAVILSGSPGEAMASPMMMANLHRDMVAGRIQVMRVDTLYAAGQMLAKADPASPALPQAPETHVMACCMKNVSDKRVACVLLKTEDAPITMSVADAKDMKPVGTVASRDGSTYHLASHEGVNMVSTERSGRWVCLMSELPTDKLVDIAAKLQF